MTAQQNFQYIMVETHQAVGKICLNRPEAMNALSSPMMAELGQALEHFETDPAIGAIVITGGNKVFAAGADIKELQNKTYMDAYLNDFLSFGWEKISHCRKPVVAAVAGFALGGGCELAMMCDVLIAADNAKFGQPEITLGTLPGLGGTQRLVRAVGKAKAMEMCLTGRLMRAEEAERSGLVTRIVAVEELQAEAQKTAQKIASMSRPAVLMVKESVQRAFETPLAEGLRFERRLFQSSLATEDKKEGMAAFVEKRPPSFKHC